jgi:ketosteroid isomerase-like protein
VEHPNIERMKRYAHAWMMGDQAGAMSHFADDVLMHIPGRNPLAGDYRGHAGFQQYAERLGEILGEGGSFAVTGFHDILANDDHAIGLVHEKAERPSAGKSIELNRVVVYDLRDGKIAEIWIHDADQYALDEFLG